MSSLQDGGRHKKSTGSTTVQNGTKVRRKISEPFRTWEQEGANVERAEVAERYRVANDGSFLVKLVNGELVVEHWLTTMKRWGSCLGCAAQWRQNLKSSAPSRRN